MITIIESIFGSKLGRFIAEVLAAVALVAIFVLHYEHKGATEELGKLQQSSAALIAKANEDIAKETAAHAADVKANQEKIDEALAANSALGTTLAQRVRDFNAYRAAHPDVPRPSGVSGATGEGSCGATSCGDIAGRLAEAGNELAASVGELTATLQGCQRDRDSLTGLPRETK
jgi:hypothetical protein